MKRDVVRVDHPIVHRKIEWSLKLSVKEGAVSSVASNFSLPYFTLTPTFSICPTHKYISGEHKTCPECGAVCDVYSRVVGFYKKVSSWNEGKVAEFNDRTSIAEKQIDTKQ